MRARIAGWLTRRLYRRPLVADLPASKLYFLMTYGTPRKVANYLRVRDDYRRMRTTVTSRPYVIRADPITHCNLRCPLCPTGLGEIDRGRTPMTPEGLDAILERCGGQALYVALWIWGEPLLNKQLPELVRVCKRRGIGTEVSSHLSLPMRQERIDDLVTSGLDWLIVSIDAAKASTYERYRVGGDFERVLANIRAIRARREALGSSTPFIEWQFVPLRHNEGEMQDAVRLAREVGADGVRFKPARLDKTHGRTFAGTIPVELVREWAPSDPRLVHTVTPERRSFLDHHCSFLWISVSVYHDGAVAPCCETTRREDDLGNLHERPFEEIWNGPSYVTARRVALGLPAGPQGEALACHSCKVFSKPLAPPRVAHTPTT